MSQWFIHSREWSSYSWLRVRYDTVSSFCNPRHRQLGQCMPSLLPSPLPSPLSVSLRDVWVGGWKGGGLDGREGDPCFGLLLLLLLFCFLITAVFCSLFFFFSEMKRSTHLHHHSCSQLLKLHSVESLQDRIECRRYVGFCLWLQAVIFFP